MSRYKQIGRNNKYPEEISVWKLGESVPTWLSDISKVTIDNTGKIEIQTKTLSSGGYDIISSDGRGVVIRVNNSDDFVCFGGGKLVSLSKKQINLLYEEKKGRS